MNGATSAICNSPGVWTLTVAKTNFTEGPSSFTVKQADIAGNSTTVNGSVTKDSIPPTLTLTSVTGSTIINQANVASFGIKGACSEEGRSVQISGAISGLAACTGNAWVLTSNFSAVADGNLNLSATHSDAAGNTVTQNLILTKDTTAPTLSIVSPTEGQAVTTNSFTFSGACSENGRTVSISGSVNGSTSCQGGAWSVSFDVTTVTANGSVKVATTDGAENSASVTRNFTNSSPGIREPLLQEASNVSMSEASICAVDNGALKCWGENVNVKPGTNTSSPSKPITVIASGAQAVSMNYRQGCAIASGALYCWDTLFPQAPMNRKMVIASGVQAVSVGALHTCAIVNGALQCWGGNSAGQIGNGTTIESAVPVTVIPSGVQAVAAGYARTCAIVRKALQCWGQNDEGQLGIGTKSDFVATPVTVIADGVQAVSGSWKTTCAIVNGGLRCWGLNFYHQINNDPHYWLMNPFTVINDGVQAVAVGEKHSCAIVSGSMKCWGDNESGELGTGTSGSNLTSSTPLTVITTGVQAIFASRAQGFDHSSANTCAIVNGRLQCWGDNLFGQLGSGETTNSPTPLTVIAGGAQSVDTGGYDDFGGGNTCAVINRSLQCWGSFRYGPGVNPGGLPSQPLVPYTVIPSGVEAVSQSNNFGCAIVNGSLQCWGANESGQMANATLNRISDLVTVVASEVKAVSTGYRHVCAIVKDAVKCWGGNGFFALGNGRYDNSRNLVTVIASGAQAVSSGNFHTCAIVNGALQCWGYNVVGQIGNGTTINSPTPVTVIPSGVQAVSASGNSTCAVVNGSLQCWGRNDGGQLGNGTRQDSLTPMTIIPSGVQSVSGTCAIVSGAVQCWGSNFVGELGNGTSLFGQEGNGPPVGFDELSLPVTVIASGAQSVSAHNDHVCAVVNDAVKCWGKNNVGESNPSKRLKEITPGTDILTGLSLSN